MTTGTRLHAQTHETKPTVLFVLRRSKGRRYSSALNRSADTAMGQQYAETEAVSVA